MDLHNVRCLWITISYFLTVRSAFRPRRRGGCCSGSSGCDCDSGDCSGCDCGDCDCSGCDCGGFDC